VTDNFSKGRKTIIDCLNFLPFSGMLTGKYKRGVKPDKSEGRIGLVAQDESKATQAAPAWSQYENSEDFWKLLQAMEKIAKEYGM
jgi:aryl-alcohol dehydrogenase-like predicted oxidoreductase